MKKQKNSSYKADMPAQTFTDFIEVTAMVVLVALMMLYAISIYWKINFCSEDEGKPFTANIEQLENITKCIDTCLEVYGESCASISFNKQKKLCTLKSLPDWKYNGPISF